MTRYKVVLNILICNRGQHDFMEACGFGDVDYGVNNVLSFTTTTKPTMKYINNMIDKLNSTKDHKEFDVYYAGVSLNRVEVIADD